MQIKSLMRDAGAVVAPTERLAVAASRLASDPERCLVVVERGRVAGVLTEADVRAAGASTLATLAAHEWPFLLDRLTVADAMRGEPIVAAPGSDAASVARALRARDQRAAVVTDGGEVVGVVSVADLLGALVERLERTPAGLTRLIVGNATLAARDEGRPHAALDVALDIARRHGAALTLVHVIPWLSRRVAEGLPAGVEADLHRWRLTRALAALWRLVPDDVPGVCVEVKAGAVAAALVESAAATDAELIVLGWHPGSAVVRETMRRAPCPVLAA
jgi:CBS domain-containing protein/nucleotide-binding universal stress UspA family protein